MGSTLPGIGTAVSAPTFLIQAFRDPVGDNLDRIQIIKGWVNARGEALERIYDVAWSDDRKPDPDTGKLPPVGNTVDVKKATYTNTIGEPLLAVYWEDPDFDPSERAYYYARIVENPTCRWSTWDAVKAGVAPRPDVHATIQERAWTSPIWYVPEA